MHIRAEVFASMRVQKVSLEPQRMEVKKKKTIILVRKKNIYVSFDCGSFDCLHS